MSVTAVIFITFVGLLFIGAPITLSLGAAAMGGMIVSGKPLEGLVEIAYTSAGGGGWLPRGLRKREFDQCQRARILRRTFML
jgi:hypothetical protein